MRFLPLLPSEVFPLISILSSCIWEGDMTILPFLILFSPGRIVVLPIVPLDVAASWRQPATPCCTHRHGVDGVHTASGEAPRAGGLGWRASRDARPARVLSVAAAQAREHVSFNFLGTNPGGALICHLMPYGHTIWAKNVKRSPAQGAEHHSALVTSASAIKRLVVFCDYVNTSDYSTAKPGTRYHTMIVIFCIS
jgi:hypothetical protein